MCMYGIRFFNKEFCNNNGTLYLPLFMPIFLPGILTEIAGGRHHLAGLIKIFFMGREIFIARKFHEK